MPRLQARIVDFVMCTHLHVDTSAEYQLENGRGVPTFPNAKYLFRQARVRALETEHKTQGKETNGGSFDDSLLPIVEAGKAVMIDSDHQPDPLLTIKDYPVTPGSIAINLAEVQPGLLLAISCTTPRSTPGLVEPVCSDQDCRQEPAQAAGGAARATRCSAGTFSPAHAGFISLPGRLQDRMDKHDRHSVGRRRASMKVQKTTPPVRQVAIVSAAARPATASATAVRRHPAAPRHKVVSPTSTRSWRRAPAR